MPLAVDFRVGEVNSLYIVHCLGSLGSDFLIILLFVRFFNSFLKLLSVASIFLSCFSIFSWIFSIFLSICCIFSSIFSSIFFIYLFNSSKRLAVGQYALQQLSEVENFYSDYYHTISLGSSYVSTLHFFNNDPPLDTLWVWPSSVFVFDPGTLSSVSTLPGHFYLLMLQPVLTPIFTCFWLLWGFWYSEVSSTNSLALGHNTSKIILTIWSEKQINS